MQRGQGHHHSCDGIGHAVNGTRVRDTNHMKCQILHSRLTVKKDYHNTGGRLHLLSELGFESLLDRGRKIKIEFVGKSTQYLNFHRRWLHYTPQKRMDKVLPGGKAWKPRFCSSFLSSPLAVYEWRFSDLFFPSATTYIKIKTNIQSSGAQVQIPCSCANGQYEYRCLFYEWCAICPGVA